MALVLPHWWRSEEGLAGFTGEGGGHPPVAQSTVLSFGLGDACLLRIYNSQKKSLGGYTLPGPPRVSRLFCTMRCRPELIIFTRGPMPKGCGYRGQTMECPAQRSPASCSFFSFIHAAALSAASNKVLLARSRAQSTRFSAKAPARDRH